VTDLLHLARRQDWLDARRSGSGDYRISTRGRTLEEQGFIHCSLPHQLRGVAEALYADADDLVVLVIDSVRLTGPVRYEAAEAGGEQYPHLYGPLPLDAVTRVVPVSRDEAGRFVLPD
jgi:uncharacterized protein (DUF952 family)